MNTTSTYSVEQVVDGVLAKFGTELNPGSIAKAVNTALLVFGVKKVEDDETESDYQVTPQMMNNYGKNGMFDKVKHDSMKGVVYTREVIRTWMITFLTNKVNGRIVRGSTVQAAELALAVKAELGKPNTVVVNDDKVAPVTKAAPAAQAAPKK